LCFRVSEATSEYVVNLMVLNFILTTVTWMSSWDPNPPTDAGSLCMDGAVGSIFDILGSKLWFLDCRVQACTMETDRPQ
jgi:hypothetical protein